MEKVVNFSDNAIFPAFLCKSITNNCETNWDTRNLWNSIFHQRDQRDRHEFPEPTVIRARVGGNRTPQNVTIIYISCHVIFVKEKQLPPYP